MELIIFNRDMDEQNGGLPGLTLRNRHITNELHFRTLDSMIDHLLTFSEIPRVVVLVGADLELMSKLQRQAGILTSVQLVLVLSNHDPESIHLGHSLHPRYLTFRNGNQADLIGVLEGIIARIKSQ